jgi:hypothetical protein
VVFYVYNTVVLESLAGASWQYAVYVDRIGSDVNSIDCADAGAARSATLQRVTRDGPWSHSYLHSLPLSAPSSATVGMLSRSVGASPAGSRPETAPAQTAFDCTGSAFLDGLTADLGRVGGMCLIVKPETAVACRLSYSILALAGTSRMSARSAPEIGITRLRIHFWLRTSSFTSLSCAKGDASSSRRTFGRAVLYQPRSPLHDTIRKITGFRV